MRGRRSRVATVFGTVTDSSGAVIARAQVVIVNQTTGLKRESSTDSTGQYHIAGLPTGNYSVRVQKDGFQTQVREGITLTSASNLTMRTDLLRCQHTRNAEAPAALAHQLDGISVDQFPPPRVLIEKVPPAMFRQQCQKC